MKLSTNESGEHWFKGSQYWRFSTPGQLDSGYPKTLSDGFEGIPDNVDAALVWAANSKIYFFKGDLSVRDVILVGWGLDIADVHPPLV